MDDEIKTFPVYRKYVGINVWFKIIDKHNFIEIKQIGTKYIKHTVEANQYPEMVLINDMINCHEGRWEEAEAEVFDSLMC